MGKERGFTLIELMVVVAIVAILAAIAVPAFNDQIRRSNRSEAMVELQNRQLAMERWRANNGVFTGAPVAAATQPKYQYAAVVTPAAVCPVGATCTAANSYDLTATARGGQTADRQGATSCSTLTIRVTPGSNEGVKLPTECWRR